MISADAEAIIESIEALQQVVCDSTVAIYTLVCVCLGVVLWRVIIVAARSRRLF